MSNRDSEKIFHRIRHALQEHEEPYQLGAWENFQRYKASRSKLLFIKRISGIAASLIFVILASVALFLQSDPVTENITLFNPEVPVMENDEEGVQLHPDDKSLPELSEELSVSDDRITQNSIPDQTLLEYSGFEIEKSGPDQNMKRGIGLLAGYPEISVDRSDQTAPVTGQWMQEDRYREGVPVMDRQLVAGHSELFRESAVTITPGQLSGRKARKLSLGLSYATFMNMHHSNVDLNMGLGVDLNLLFGKKFTFFSGIFIAQNRLSYKENNQLLLRTGSSHDEADLQADLLSFEIPLGLTYSISEKFFISAGISAASFLQEDYNYSYSFEEEIELTVYVDGEGYQRTTTTVTTTVEDVQSEPSMNTFHLPGFYTISAGYKYPIHENHTLSMEPFLKIPAGNLATRGVRYSTAGIKLMLAI